MKINLSRTEGFRVTAIFVAILALSAAVLASSVLYIVDDEFRDQIIQFANSDIAAVHDGYRTEGLHEAREVIAQRMAAPGASDFFLLQQNNVRLAGNLAAMPPRTGILTLPPPDGRAGHAILGLGTFIAPGLYIFSGSDLYHANLARTRILRTSFWVLAGTLALAVLGGFAVSRSLLSRTDAIAQACRAIMAGNLKTRIPLRGTRDELDRLSETINAMLDRIAALMENLRQVTNDIAHDLRTPVTHLRHRLERMRSEAVSAVDQDRALETAIAASDEILALFAALLRIAQIEGGARRAGFARVDLAVLLSQLRDLFVPVAEDADHQLEIETFAPVPVRGGPGTPHPAFLQPDRKCHHAYARRHAHHGRPGRGRKPCGCHRPRQWRRRAARRTCPAVSQALSPRGQPRHARLRTGPGAGGGDCRTAWRNGDGAQPAPGWICHHRVLARRGRRLTYQHWENLFVKAGYPAHGKASDMAMPQRPEPAMIPRLGRLLAVTLCVLGTSALDMPAWAASSGYHVLRTIALGGDGGWDYLNRDPLTGNLFITRGNHLMVVDPASGKTIGDITELAGIHGTAFAGGRAYISEGGANRVAVIDSKSLAKLSTIAVGTRPDGILYDDASKRIFTFNGGSSDATAIDPASGAVVGTVALGGKPEAAASDGAGTIFVNIENKNELVAFDAAGLAVKAPLSAGALRVAFRPVGGHRP